MIENVENRRFAAAPGQGNRSDLLSMIESFPVDGVNPACILHVRLLTFEGAQQRPFLHGIVDRAEIANLANLELPSWPPQKP